MLCTLWESRGEKVSFEGRYVQLSDVDQGPAPLQDPLPLLVAATVIMRSSALR